MRRGDRGEHLGVHDVFDAGNLLGRQGREMRKVEPQPMLVDERSLLFDVIAQHLSKRRV